MPEPNGKTERAPLVAVGSWLFSWAGAAFLAGLLLATLVMPAGETTEEVTLTSREIGYGERVFNGEGCSSCHSRMVREVDRGMGSAATLEMMSETGFWPGSSRIGPDLQNLSLRYPRSLLDIRLHDPSALQPSTVMPSYRHIQESRKAALVEYLLKTVPVGGVMEEIRRVNGIEPSVPDEVITWLERYIEPETGVLVPPIRNTPQFRITGSGIYNSRCAACHGLEGMGDGPASWQRMDGGGHISVVAPSSFARDEFPNQTDAMIYWRILEGVPGSGMPAWGDDLTEEALWYLVGYVRSLALQAGETGEVEIEPTEALWEEIPLEPDEEYSFYEGWEINVRDREIDEEEAGTKINSTENASGEDGGGSLEEETLEATDSVEEESAGEDTL